MEFQRLGNRSYKERRTATHVYFVGGPFSQWYAAPMIADIDVGHRYRDQRFNTCEQFMMAGKALLFHDIPVFEAIMRETNPKEQKALGRKVRGLAGGTWDADDILHWQQNAKQIVFQGNLWKFGQNPELRQYLLDTGDLYLVEGAWYDDVWGVKLAYDDPRIEDPANWRGTNWLGEVLMDVRQNILDNG